jgi:hypothetical protein
MWTKGVRSSAPTERVKGRISRASAVVLVLAAAILGACGGDAPEADVQGGAATAPASDAPAAVAEPATEEPATIADIFPDGPGKQLVMNNCASCHEVACAAIGQRPAGRWDELREAHREHVPSLTEEDLTTTFAYLRDNFGADQPEPEVPARFLQRGCTPF